jgi:hypothetical protein
MFVELNEMPSGRPISIDINNIGRIAPQADPKYTEIYPVQSNVEYYVVQQDYATVLAIIRSKIRGYVAPA